MSEIVEDYLDAEGVQYTVETYREQWGEPTTDYTVHLSKGRTVNILTSSHVPQVRIIYRGEHPITESFVSVTDGNPALVQSIVRAAINQL